MVLVAIDNNDCVTVADVGKQNTFRLQVSAGRCYCTVKGASAIGPFWIMSYDKGSSAVRRKAIKLYAGRFERRLCRCFVYEGDRRTS